MASCPVCGTETAERYRENDHAIHECSECSHLSVPLVEFRDPDEDVEFFNVDDARINLRRYSHVHDVHLAELEQRLGRTGTVLDIGCGFGFFLDRARSFGWDPYGVDVSAVGIDHGRDHLKLDNLHRSGFTVDLFAGMTFDVVTLWNVLEHVTDPAELLASVSKVLAPGGIIAVRVPNVDAQRRRIGLGDRMPSSVVARAPGIVDVSVLAGEPPHHLQGFTPTSLAMLLDRDEFGLVETTIEPSVISDFAKSSAQRVVGSGIGLAIRTARRASGAEAALALSPSMTAMARRR